MRTSLLALLLVLACDRSVSREPLRIGARNDVDSRKIAMVVANRLRSAGCVVEHRLDLADPNRALRDGELDAYVESHAAALTKILGRKAQPGPATEVAVRTAYIKADLLWAPPVGIGDLAVVFRKDVDARCRNASRTFMATSSMMERRR